MEFVIGILILIGINVLWRAIMSGGSAAIRTAQGKGNFSENMSYQWEGMGPLEIRKVDFNAGEKDEDPKGIAIEVKGLIPVTTPTNLGFVTSVVDVTDKDNTQPVLCELEAFQEPDSPAFSHVQNVGLVELNQGYISWTRVGVVFPDLLTPAYGGNRKLMIVTRLVDTDNPPGINLGFGESDDPRQITSRFVYYDFNYQGKGFKEAGEHRDEARALAIRLGMAVALADGTLDDSEGSVIKEWVTKTIAPFSDSKRGELKSLYNEAIRNAYADAKAGNLVLSQATQRLNEIAERPQKYEAIELCFDVMAADGIADESEMDSIRRIAEALELDFEEIETLRDKALIGLDVGLAHHASLETIIGIQDDWSAEKVKAYIRIEFSKWNNRLNTLPEGPERENAQRMLDMLSEARKKYA